MSKLSLLKSSSKSGLDGKRPLRDRLSMFDCFYVKCIIQGQLNSMQVFLKRNPETDQRLDGDREQQQIGRRDFVKRLEVRRWRIRIFKLNVMARIAIRLDGISLFIYVSIQLKFVFYIEATQTDFFCIITDHHFEYEEYDQNFLQLHTVNTFVKQVSSCPHQSPGCD